MKIQGSTKETVNDEKIKRIAKAIRESLQKKPESASKKELRRQAAAAKKEADEKRLAKKAKK